MAFKFKFQAILDIKTRLEDLKKVKFGEATEELRVQIEKLNIIIYEQEEQCRIMKEKNNDKITVKDLIAHNNYMIRLKKNREIQHLVVEKAEKKLEEARIELVEASRERKKYELLREKKLAEYWEDYYKKEQMSLDEIVSYKYNGGTAK